MVMITKKKKNRDNSSKREKMGKKRKKEMHQMHTYDEMYMLAIMSMIAWNAYMLRPISTRWCMRAASQKSFGNPGDAVSFISSCAWWNRVL